MNFDTSKLKMHPIEPEWSIQYFMAYSNLFEHLYQHSKHSPSITVADIRAEVDRVIERFETEKGFRKEWKSA